METILKLFFISSLLVNEAFTTDKKAETVIIETPFGKLEGTTSISRQGKEFYSFRGIPYAEKVGRFEIGKPVLPWTGVKEAKKFGNSCPQFDPFTKSIIGNEECNFLNVYTSVLNVRNKPNEDGGLPVMVYIHGGGFVMGKSDDWDPMFFMDFDTIIVTLNYRLGALGFLDTGDDLVPPNLGLRDQVLALEFVQKAIRAFGGDAKKVTIFGNSAGGASVSFHMLSKMSKGLFRNAISMAGNALAPGVVQRDPTRSAKAFGESLNCSSDKLVECLKTKTIEELLQAQIQTVKWFMFPFNIFVPSVEMEGSKYPRFLENNPLSLMKDGKFHNVPWINGFVEDEGTIISAPLIMDEKHLSEINKDWSRVLPIALDYEHITNEEVRDNVSTRILQHYFGTEEISEETWESLTQLFSDRYFIHSSDQSSRLHAKLAPVYQYQFSFPAGGGDSPLMKNAFGVSGDYGVSHTDELQYLFNGAYGAKEHTDPDRHEIYELSEKFVKLWISFAKNNKPTATWKKEFDWKPIPNDISDHAPIQFYDISSETKLSDGGYKKRISFWNKLDVDNSKLQFAQKATNKDEL